MARRKKARFDAGAIPLRARQERLASEPVQLRLEPALALFPHDGERYGQRPQSLRRLSVFRVSLGQQSQKVRPPQLRPRGPPDSQPLTYLRDPRRALPLQSQR